VANIIWGLATLGWQASSDLGAVLQQLADAFAHEHGPVKLSTAHSSQVFQAHLASPFLGLRLIVLPSSMLEVAVKTYREEAWKVTVSNGQREVGESLRRLGRPHELECITADGLFSIDLAIVDRRVALEFDGPSHFTRNIWSHSATPACAIGCCQRWGGTLCRFPSSSGTGCISGSTEMPTWSVECMERVVSQPSRSRTLVRTVPIPSKFWTSHLACADVPES
jgi:hypothetical protein